MLQRSQSTLLGGSDLLVQSVTDYAIFMLDANGRIVSWNAGAERLKGYSADEIIGEHFSRFYTAEEKRSEVPLRALATAAAEGRFEAEGWRVRKDGTQFWANVVIDPIFAPGSAEPEVIGFAKVTRDLTERKRSEEKLRRSEERFRLLVEGVTDYAIYMLDPSGRVTSWNAGAERFKGYRADEIIGQHFSRFYSEEDVRAGIPAHALKTAIEQGHFEAEGWRIRKDGQRFWANVVIDPIRDPLGELIGFAKITRDLTERRENQIALERSQEASFQSRKMEAIGQLTGGVAHDFNNLLSAILGSLDLAERRLAAGEDASRFLKNARNAAERGAVLTQRMLAFARKQELQIETVDMAAIVQGMAELLNQTSGPDVDVEMHFAPGLAKVRTDPAQFELSLLNLVVNARDAMPAGGVIRIAGRTADMGEADAGLVCLSVADEGLGMDAETLNRSVEPFFTTKGVGKGTGLGLSMVQGLAQQCGGRFALRSTPGEGTTAELWLPVGDIDLQARPAAQGTTAAASSIAQQARPLEILAVDDDTIILMNTAMILEEMGHRVHEATCGAMALSILAQREIDLLVTDFAMPGMAGDELIEQALAANPGLKAIVVSGYADLPRGRTIAVPRLAKPFSEAELARAVAAVMEP